MGELMKRDLFSLNRGKTPASMRRRLLGWQVARAPGEPLPQAGGLWLARLPSPGRTWSWVSPQFGHLEIMGCIAAHFPFISERIWPHSEEPEWRPGIGP